MIYKKNYNNTIKMESSKFIESLVQNIEKYNSTSKEKKIEELIDSLYPSFTKNIKNNLIEASLHGKKSIIFSLPETFEIEGITLTDSIIVYIRDKIIEKIITNDLPQLEYKHVFNVDRFSKNFWKYEISIKECYFF